MLVYGPPTNKVLKLKENNQNYWALLISRSQYSADEILASLDSIEVANTQLEATLNEGYNLLIDEDGPMNPMAGYASDTYKKLDQAIRNADYISPSFSQNDHKNCFPVRKWESEITKLHNKIKKIKKIIKELS